VLLFRSDRATFRFTGIDAPPVASLLRGYSAPVRLVQASDADELALLAAHDSDGFNRWFAADRLARSLFLQTLAQGTPDPALLTPWTTCLARVLGDREADPALVAEMLTLADAGSLVDALSNIDPDAVHEARSRIESALAIAIATPLLETYERLTASASTADDLSTQARRRLRNVCLAALCRSDHQQLDRARVHFKQAENLTDRLAGLSVLVNLRAVGADEALAEFADHYRNDALVLDKWFALQAGEADPRALARVESLTRHPAFRWSNPNNVYALLGAFALRNPRGFHAADGSAYRFVADAIVRLDAITPQVAARLATAFGAWRNYEPVRRALMHRELERLSAHGGQSPDLADIVARSLAG
jgi:aminopeptidase N